VEGFSSYKGTTAVVTGAAGSGMGGTTAARLIELGAEVYALDLEEVTAPVKKYIRIDLGKKDAIERAAEQLPAKVDCLFNCAAAPGRPFSNLETSLVNFVGLRHLTEILIPRIKSGGAIASISSHGGTHWRQRLDPIRELLNISDWEESVAWLVAHEDIDSGYRFAKECVIVYTRWRAPELGRREIRINCIAPGPTTTPMYKRYWEKGLVTEGRLASLQGLCGRNATPDEMAGPLLFLNSSLASHITAETLYVDYGCTAAVEMGLREPHRFSKR